MVGPSEARMKNDALKKKETAETYSSDASEADSKNNDCPVSKKDHLLVSGLTSVPRGVSENMSENKLSETKTSFNDHILVPGSAALVQKDLSEPVSETILPEKQTGNNEDKCEETVLNIVLSVLSKSISEKNEEKSDETASDKVLAEKEKEHMSENALRVASKPTSENNEDKSDKTVSAILLSEKPPESQSKSLLLVASKSRSEIALPDIDKEKSNDDSDIVDDYSSRERHSDEPSETSFDSWTKNDKEQSALTNANQDKVKTPVVAEKKSKDNIVIDLSVMELDEEVSDTLSKNLTKEDEKQKEQIDSTQKSVCNNSPVIEFSRDGNEEEADNLDHVMTQAPSVDDCENPVYTSKQPSKVYYSPAWNVYYGYPDNEDIVKILQKSKFGGTLKDKKLAIEDIYNARSGFRSCVELLVRDEQEKW